MTSFDTMKLPDRPDIAAPDGSDVRILLGLAAGGMAHFELPPGQTMQAVTHRTVGEIWYVVGGRGEMWRSRSTDPGSLQFEVIQPPGTVVINAS